MGWTRGYRGFPKDVALRILKEEPFCRGCGAPSTEADHIVGRADGLAAGVPLQRLQARDNGQALCAACHAAKTKIERARGRTRGMKWRETERHPGLS